MVDGAYNTAIMADSPIVYWKLSDTSAGVMLDSSGNGRNGNYFGTPVFSVPGLIADDAITGETAINFAGDALGTMDMVSAGVPIAYWKLTELSGTLMDSSGNGRHITAISGPVVYGTAGIASDDAVTGEKSMTFGQGAPAAFSYISKTTTGDADWDFTTKFTVEAQVHWLGFAETPNYAQIVGRGSPNSIHGNFGWHLLIDSGGLRFRVQSSNGTYYTATTTISTGVSTRITGVCDGTSLKIYKNGVLATTTAFAGSVVNNSSLIAIGGYPYVSSLKHFSGRIEKIVIFDEALTAGQIAARSWQSSVSTSTFQSWLNFPQMTAEAIIKMDIVGDGYQIIVERDANGPRGSVGRIWNLIVSDGYPSFSLQTTLTDFINVSAANKLVAGVVYHVAGTFDGVEGKLYVNGALVASKPLSGQMIQPFLQGITVGNDEDQALPLKGTAEKVAIYNKALTAEQIAAHWAAASSTAATPTMSSAVGSTSGAGAGANGGAGGGLNGGAFFIGAT